MKTLRLIARNPKTEKFKMMVGQRVAIAEVDSVYRDLHGLPGVITRVNVGFDFNSAPMHEITLDEIPPGRSSQSWILREDQISPLKT